MKQRVRPYHLVIGFGVVLALYGIASGVLPLITDWFDDCRRAARGLRRHPGSWKLRLLHAASRCCSCTAAARSPTRVKNWERGMPDRRAHHAAERCRGDSGTSEPASTCRRCCAIRPRASCTRSSTSRSSSCSPSRSSSQIQDQVPEDWKFLHGQVYQAYAFVGDAAGVAVPPRRRLGDRAPVRPAAVPHPHQDASPSTPPSSACSSSSASPASSPRPSHRDPGPARLREVELRRLPAVVAVPQRRPPERLAPGAVGSRTWSLFFAFLVMLPVTMIRHMFTSPLNMYLRDRERPKGAMKADAEPHGDRARDVRRVDRRGLHVEAVARHRRVHDVRTLHVGVSRARHRQAARPARDRAEDRRGDGCDRDAAGVAADRRRARDHRHRRLAVRAHHARGDLGVHVVQGVRRDLPGQHRDPRQDPRHAALPVADGVELPDRARQRVPVDGEQRQPVGHEPGRPRRLDEQGRRRRRSSTVRRRSTTSTSTGSAARARSTTRTRRSRSRWRSCCSAPASTSRSSVRPRTAPAIRPAARATSTSSRCSPCRTSRRSTAWA